MKKIVLICVSALMLVLAGCGKDDTKEQYKTDTTFGVEKGIAVGIADFSEEEPEISIKNIVTYVGKEIDYSTGIEVSNTEKYDDFQMWVDASAVDIHTVGSYEAIYKFIYGDKTKEIKVIVSVIENTETANEPSGGSVASGQDNNGNSNADKNNNSNNNNSNNNNNNSSNNAGNNNGGNSAENGSSGNNSNGNGSGGSNNSVSNNGENSNGGNAGGGNGSGQNKTGSTPSANQPNPTANNNAKPTQNSTEQTTTARRQIVTSSGQVNTKTYSLGYMNIELLSGSVVKIKCTSSKYIVSTRTDVSATEKNGVNYKVYKLVVTYNTGAEQVLETYEEKINQ